MEISINARQYSYGLITAAASPKTENNAFGEVLAKEKQKKQPPDKWVTEAGSTTGGVKAAAEFMQNELGIDTRKIEPTHEITPEQMDWLRSRHDFSTMKKSVWYSYKVEGDPTTQYRCKTTPEFSNFLGDLMYLGVYTEQELTVDLWVEPLDTRPGASNSVLSERLPTLGGSVYDLSRAVVSNLENMWNFYNERSKGAFAVKGDAEFAALIKEHYLPMQQKFFEFIDKLIRDDDEFQPPQTAVPDIEDRSGKLKEDFGGMIS